MVIIMMMLTMMMMLTSSKNKKKSRICKSFFLVYFNCSLWCHLPPEEIEKKKNQKRLSPSGRCRHVENSGIVQLWWKSKFLRWLKRSVFKASLFYHAVMFGSYGGKKTRYYCCICIHIRLNNGIYRCVELFIYKHIQRGVGPYNKSFMSSLHG